MKELIGRLFQVDVLTGMGVTFRAQHSANPWTQQYSLEMMQNFEIAYYSREAGIWDRQRLEEGPTPTRYTR
jgi:hypothetical protein